MQKNKTQDILYLNFYGKHYKNLSGTIIGYSSREFIWDPYNSQTTHKKTQKTHYN